MLRRYRKRTRNIRLGPVKPRSEAFEAKQKVKLQMKFTVNGESDIKIRV